MNSAWADFIDARVRVVHEMRADGLPYATIATRVSLDADEVERISHMAIEPPIPGTSRDQLRALRRRLVALERLAHAEPARTTEPAPPVKASHIRALVGHPDARLCGCQYWAGAPETGHHLDCPYHP